MKKEIKYIVIAVMVISLFVGYVLGGGIFNKQSDYKPTSTYLTFYFQNNQMNVIPGSKTPEEMCKSIYEKNDCLIRTSGFIPYMENGVLDPAISFFCWCK